MLSKHNLADVNTGCPGPLSGPFVASWALTEHLQRLLERLQTRRSCVDTSQRGGCV